MSSLILRNWDIVAMSPAVRFKPPIIEGANDCTFSGKVPWAKFAVPVIVESIITGKVNRILERR
jgi:hypothetical protein